MRVRLTTSIFSFETYELEIEDGGLVFTQAQKRKTRIPFESIQRFDLEGDNKSPQHFVLTTREESLEGCFLEEGSAAEVITALKNKCGCYINVQLNME